MIVVDSSALIAILEEEYATTYAAAIQQAHRLLIRRSMSMRPESLEKTPMASKARIAS